MPATQWNWRLRERQLQQQAVSTPQWMVPGGGTFHTFGYSDMTLLVCATVTLLVLNMCKRRPYISASD
jgi:hypothetical protein